MILYKVFGFVFVGLAAIGLLLPLMPATPFLLLAAGFFAKSSAKNHQWLMSNRIFGPVVKDWDQKKCIAASVKVSIISSILLFGGFSMLFVATGLYLKVLALLLITPGLFFVIRIKTCGPEPIQEIEEE